MKTINLLPKQPKQWVALQRYQKPLIIVTSGGLFLFCLTILSIVIFELFIFNPLEEQANLQGKKLEDSIATLLDRQASLMAVSGKADITSRLIDGRFAFDRVLTDLFSLTDAGTSITDTTIEKNGNLSFTVRTRNADDVRTLIAKMTQTQFSPSFTYILKQSIRSQSGIYLLDFSFTPKG